MKGNLHHLHDKLIKETFSNLDLAKAYFKEFLPEPLLKEIELDSLALINGSFLSDDLSEYFTDLVYNIKLQKINTSLFLTLLFEHKSRKDKNTLIQVGNYIFNQWSREIKSKTPLQPIIPFIYYQGKESWVVPSISEIFSQYPDIVRKYLPNFDFIYFAINSLSTKQLEEITHTMLYLALAGHHPQMGLLDFFERIKKILSLTSLEKTERNFLNLIFVYKINQGDYKIDEIKSQIESLPAPINTELMSTYDLIKAEGKAEGKIEGKVEGKTEMILAMASDGFETEIIARLSGMSMEQVLNILKK